MNQNSLPLPPFLKIKRDRQGKNFEKILLEADMAEPKRMFFSRGVAAS